MECVPLKITYVCPCAMQRTAKVQEHCKPCWTHASLASAARAADKLEQSLKAMRQLFRRSAK